MTSGELLDQARITAKRLASCRVAFVACSYDTAFEPVSGQVQTKIEQLQETFGPSGPVRWSLWLVDDLPAAAGFTAAVRTAYEAYPDLLNEGRLHVVPLISGPRRGGWPKGAGAAGWVSAGACRA